ncbi:helix-turn-helix transcriptional regulator [Roseococcus sp. SDR]|uniref:helix-turn-helix domain-containing protein n=1 Tax=Roseococcus sp. SDR TaxID=2835532 RepID=UPI001BCFE371|nr:helix-turn-helix transcriptional regulator [Roseococcus sp. SDR]MBS7788560.1 helix-turn-helix transcriptional regulator [Roseococcus sp. SDR]MBV1843874.1 helix-turn-helix transcriptional regulator [Roseococcus sp. SDR]
MSDMMASAGPGGSARRQRLDHELDVEIGRRLRARRRARRLTLQQLADISGLTVQQIQRSESGAARVTVVVLLRLAEALQTPPLALLPVIAPEKAPEAETDDQQRATAHDLALGLAQYLWKQGSTRDGSR